MSVCFAGMSKVRAAAELAALFFGHIPIAGSLYLSSLQLSQSMEKSAEKISDGVKQGLEGHMSAEGAGKQHLADGLEHLSQAMVRRSASTALGSNETL